MKTLIQRDTVAAQISHFGCMTNAEFLVNDTRIRPLYQAPWRDYHGDPLLENLRGDFLCLPFGIAPASMTAFPSQWQRLDSGHAGPSHGYGANHRWELVSQQPDSACLELQYPPEDPVKQVSRTITCAEDAVEFEDQVRMRRDARLPMGLHPMLRLPKEAGTTQLNLPDCETLATLPVPTDASSVLQPDSEFDDPRSAPLLTGGTLDLTRLPLVGNTEELVLLCNVAEGKVSLDNLEEGYRVTLEWDTEYLNHCLLWISNRGRSGEPWNSTNLCLGVEPITSAFDFGESISTSDNPLSIRGFRTAVELTADRPLSLRHRISVASL